MKLKDLVKLLNIDGSEIKGTDKGTKHSYLDEYENIFYSIKENKLNILEIGIQFGGSSILWQEYFKNSKLTLIDIEYQVTDEIFQKIDQGRCEIKIMDAYNLENFNKISTKKFDIIIDDGPHTLESHVFLVENYINILSKNGILIIEDIQKEEYIDIIKSKIPENYEVNIIDLRNVKNRYDDILFIIKKIN